MATQITYNICAADSWVAAQAVTLGDRRLTGTAQLIECTIAGTTGGTSPLFAAPGDIVVDGSVTWKFLCVQDYAIHTDFIADIGVGISDTLVTDNENWMVYIWHDRRGAYWQGSTSSTIDFAEGTSATNRMVISPPAGDSIWENIERGVDPVRFDENYGTAIINNKYVQVILLNSGCGYCEVLNIQAKTNASNSYGFKSTTNGALISGCLVQAAANLSGRNLFDSGQGRLENCIAISGSTAGTTLFSVPWGGELENCLAVDLNGVSTGYWINNTSGSRLTNCVGVGNLTDFTGVGVVTLNTCTGNVSSDGTAGTQFPTQAGTISNGVDLVTDASSLANVDVQPLATSSAFVVNPAEVDFSLTPANDVFGEPRTIGVANFRGAVCSLATAVAVVLTAQDMSMSSQMANAALLAVNTLSAQGLKVSSALSNTSLVTIDQLAAAGISVAPQMAAGDLVEFAALAAQGLQVSSLLSDVTLTTEVGLAVQQMTVGVQMSSVTLTGSGALIASGLQLVGQLVGVSLGGASDLFANDLSVNGLMPPVSFSGTNALTAADIAVAAQMAAGDLSALSTLEVADMISVLQMADAQLLTAVGLDAQALITALNMQADTVTGTSSLQANSLSVQLTLYQALLVVGTLKVVVGGRLSWADTGSLSWQPDDRSLKIENAIRKLSFAEE